MVAPSRCFVTSLPLQGAARFRRTGETIGLIKSVDFSLHPIGGSMEAAACRGSRLSRQRPLRRLQRGRHFSPRQGAGCLTHLFVIPGREERASPESITPAGSMDSGPAPSGASRNDGYRFLPSIGVIVSFANSMPSMQLTLSATTSVPSGLLPRANTSTPQSLQS